jgi:hypothetical protein
VRAIVNISGMKVEVLRRVFSIQMPANAVRGVLSFVLYEA